MPAFFEEIIICFDNVSGAIMAEQALLEEGISVRVMPVPSSIQSGCGFCLRFSPEDIGPAAAFLFKRGITVTQVYMREEAAPDKAKPASYRKISLANDGGIDAAGR